MAKIEKDPSQETLKAEIKKVPKTLFFSEGFWCPELNRSFVIGYYTPKDEKEASVLGKYAGKEFNNLKPASLR